MEKKSLRDFIKNKKIDPSKIDPASIDINQMDPQQRAQYNQMRNVYEQYKNKSQGEIAQEIDRLRDNSQVQDMIRTGQLDHFVDMMKPMLDGQQAQRLNGLLKNLKK